MIKRSLTDVADSRRCQLVPVPDDIDRMTTTIPGQLDDMLQGSEEKDVGVCNAGEQHPLNRWCMNMRLPKSIPFQMRYSCYQAAGSW